jgi:hypothetical protein
VSTFNKISGCFQPGQAKDVMGPTPLVFPVKKQLIYDFWANLIAYMTSSNYAGQEDYQGHYSFTSASLFLKIASCILKVPPPLKIYEQHHV